MELNKTNNKLSYSSNFPASPVQLVKEVIDAGNTLITEKGIQILNVGSTTVYIGLSSTVNSTTGFPLAQNASVFLPIRHTDLIYVYAAQNSTIDVRYLAL